MKSVISALLIFILIITTIFFSGLYVNDTTNKMLQIVYKNEKYFSDLQWDKADNEIDKLESLWKKRRPMLSVFLNHSDLSDIDINISKLKNTTKIRDNSDFFYETDNVIHSIYNIKDQQKISIYNLF